MDAKCINPILNVSDISASFAWFEKWGWRKLWEWGTPSTFGAVGSGECEIFLCQGCQGGRGKGANTATFGPNGDEEADKGVWMSVFVDDVDVSTDSPSPLDWRSLSRQPTCHSPANSKCAGIFSPLLAMFAMRWRSGSWSPRTGRWCWHGNRLLTCCKHWRMSSDTS